MFKVRQNALFCENLKSRFIKKGGINTAWSLRYPQTGQQHESCLTSPRPLRGPNGRLRLQSQQGKLSFTYVLTFSL